MKEYVVNVEIYMSVIADNRVEAYQKAESLLMDECYLVKEMKITDEYEVERDGR